MKRRSKVDTKADLLRLLGDPTIRIEGIEENESLATLIRSSHSTTSVSCRVVNTDEICETFELQFSNSRNKRFFIFRKPKFPKGEKKEKGGLSAKSAKSNIPKPSKKTRPKKRGSVWMQFTGGFETNRSRH